METPSYLAVLRHYTLSPTLTAESAYEDIDWGVPSEEELDAMLAAYTAEYEEWQAEQVET